MTKRIFAVSALIIAGAVLTAASGPAAVSLSSKHRAWLENEAAIIITPAERDVFLKLSTDRERELFIEAFWKQRDPTPGTSRNEFRVENARRIAFADLTFGEGTPGRGRKTERGRIYITLGPPLEVQRTGKEGRRTEVWTYAGNQAYLPAAFFRIRFQQQDSLGEYGIPDASVEVEPAPGAGPSEPVLLADIQKTPQKKVDDAYATVFLERKAAVEVNYSVHAMSNWSAVQAYKDQAGFFRIHYSVVPERISVDAFDHKYLADWKITIRLTAPDGTTLYQEDKFIPIELYPAELKAIRKSAFHFYDSVPVVPGACTLAVLMENTVSKEFTSIAAAVSIPEGKGLWISPLLLARQAARVAIVPGGASRSFQVGDIQIDPAVKATFAAGNKASVFFQVHNAPAELRAAGIIEFNVLQDGRAVRSFRRSFSAYKDGLTVLEELPTETLAPGVYGLQVSLKDPTGREVLAGRADWAVTDKENPAAWILAQSNPPVEDAYYNGVLGLQYLHKNEIEMAAQELSLARYKKPDVLGYALGYAQALLARREYDMARAAVSKFAERDADSFDLFWVLGQAAQGLGDAKEAIDRYQKALVLKGDVVAVLNALGDCYLKTGDADMARQAWRKSLAIKANQPDIQNKMEAIK